MPADEVIHFTLQQLVDIFIVPEVPDVAVVNHAAYQRNLELLQQIENLCAPARHKGGLELTYSGQALD